MTKAFEMFGVAAAVFVLVLTAPALWAEEGGVGWTPDYDCDTNLFQTKHKVELGGGSWADGSHETIPGDCDVHDNFSGGPD
ncbi:MAG: hypothetical protein WEB88_07595 [Gemmatimonadota bacterium]